MELVEIVARQNFYDSRVGDVVIKQRLRVPQNVASQLASLNLIKVISNPPKAIPKIPVLLKPPVNGGAVSLASSLADQALPNPIAQPRKRGRPRKVGT